MKSPILWPIVLCLGLAATPLFGVSAARDGLPGPRPSTIPGTAPVDPLAGHRLGDVLRALARENPVLAKVENHEIHWNDVIATAKGLPVEYQTQVEALVPALLNRLVDLHLLVLAGRAAGLAEDAAVIRQVREFEDRAISEAFIAREISGRVTEVMLRDRYRAHVADVRARAEVRARHILVPSETAAWRVIRALAAGADFADLAREHSRGSSARGGGDLGFLTRKAMVPAFAEAAFGLEIGAHSRVPVKTEFGWHVIKIEDRRGGEAESFFHMAHKLRKELNRELLEEAVLKLRAGTKVEFFPEVVRALAPPK